MSVSLSVHTLWAASKRHRAAAAAALIAKQYDRLIASYDRPTDVVASCADYNIIIIIISSSSSMTMTSQRARNLYIAEFFPINFVDFRFAIRISSYHSAACRFFHFFNCFFCSDSVFVFYRFSSFIIKTSP